MESNPVPSTNISKEFEKFINFVKFKSIWIQRIKNLISAKGGGSNGRKFFWISDVRLRSVPKFLVDIKEFLVDIKGTTDLVKTSYLDPPGEVWQKVHHKTKMKRIDIETREMWNNFKINHFL